MSLLKAFVLFVSLFSVTAFARVERNPYYGEDFYRQLEAGLKDQSLKDLLSKITGSSQYNVGYDKAREFIFSVFYPVEKNGALFVKDVYCEKDYEVPGPHQGLPNGSVINVEHTWPQSKFGGKGRDFQKADLHHLFPSDSQLNSDRANLPFGEIARDHKTLKCPISRLGISSSSKSQTVFEPPPSHRGNVARALFYFSVRYQLNLDDLQEAFLRKWNKEDPIDQEEETRNDEIFKIQKNRNPFIDMSDLADHIKDF